MKRIRLFAVSGFVVIAIAGVIVFRSMAAREFSVITEVSQRAAQSLQKKIDAVRGAENSPHHKPGTARLDVSEAELESYLIYSLKDDIPAQIDSARIQLVPDTISLDTQLTFVSNATGNPIVDALVGGTHNLFFKGKLVAENARGKFDLQEIRVDGIPVPNIFIQTLFKKYVKPKYPDADLSEPFDMPWGIQELKIENGKAAVVY
jgi:hypothetical protein